MERAEANLTPRVYRILVVEDNLDSVHSTCMLLRELGHTVDYAINGYVALEGARRFKPDVVLLDLGLPGMSGYEVCEQIRRDPELRDTRIVVLTAYSEARYRERALQVGCDFFLVKPLHPEEFVRLFGEPRASVHGSLPRARAPG